MRRLPFVDDDAPIACSLSPGEVPDRIAVLERLRDTAVAVERTPHGLLLRFPTDDDVEADVRRFAVEEQRCCTFWAFSVTAEPAGVTLRWDGPPASAGLLDHLHRFLLGDEPIGSLGGLL
jgi:hypothetical protein